MNSTLRTTIASALVGSVALLVGVLSAEAAHSAVFATPLQQQHLASATTRDHSWVVTQKTEERMARLAAIDARIERLVADMNSFTGEMKITAMSELLTALVKRQSMMREEMMAMHERMMGHMKDRMMAPPIPQDDSEPDLMCAPPQER